MEKRQYFRVDLFRAIPASARISAINSKQIDVDKIIPVTLLNLSGNGMRIRMTYSLPINVVILDIKFEFENEQFEVSAQVVRKIQKGKSFEYGMKFIDFQDTSGLIRCLNMYKIKNTKFRKVEMDLRAQKYIGCFVKFLELIEAPAFIITDYRLVVAANNLAQEQGIKLGERCYKTVHNINSICEHCRLEKALLSDHVVENEAVLMRQKCSARWLNTEDGLIIHYYK